ncbi:DUF1589 domain-containing protein [Rhodopirellula sp. P2]|uniref:DUF1589 domain-containing protein n=1 Tax=Rhodopirellula sp. P2 TaxID=2127060 RepID=UPI003FD2B023
MLWNKARRHPAPSQDRDGNSTGHQPSPGGTWPTSAQTPNDSSKSGLTTSPARRPGCTWRPSRCFGTKRGVTPLHPKTEMETQLAISHIHLRYHPVAITRNPIS